MQITPNSQNRQPVDFDKLVHLMYGLGIANGLATIAPKIVDTYNHYTLLYAISALFLGIADWIFYNSINSKHNKNHIIAGINIIFPVLLYILFASSHKPTLFHTCICIYFALTYIFAFICNHAFSLKLDWLFCLPVCFFVVLIGIWWKSLASPDINLFLMSGACLISSFAWFVYVWCDISNLS